MRVTELVDGHEYRNLHILVFTSSSFTPVHFYESKSTKVIVGSSSDLQDIESFTYTFDEVSH